MMMELPKNIIENRKSEVTFDLGIWGTKSGAYDYTLSKSTLILVYDDGNIDEYHRD